MMTVEDLVKAMYGRYTQGMSAEQLRCIDGEIRNDMPGALITFLYMALDQQDLTPGEVAAALQLATAGKLYKSSAYLRDALIEYRRT